MKVKYDGEYYLVTKIISQGKGYNCKVIKERTGKETTNNKILKGVVNVALKVTNLNGIDIK